MEVDCCSLGVVYTSLHKCSKSNSCLGTTTGFDEGTQGELGP